MELPQKLLNLIDQFGKLPGVGPKTAMRQSLILSEWTSVELLKFAESIEGLNNLKKCSKCGMFADETFCNVCINPERVNSPTLCVVETISDFLAIENSGQFKGKYYILGGVLNPLMGIGPDELNIDKLVTRISSEEIKEVILAVNPSIEGDATCSYIKDQITGDVEVDRIGFGIPMGGSLEYLDALTISKALENRRHM